jgi:DNA mismatch endonuclease (patch repair protein)
MSRIRGVNTGPEVRLRSLLHKAGFRFRLHDPKLPGRPDIVLRKHHAVVFVHGCFWHRHPGCRHATTPSSRSDFWNNKFARTVERDRRKAAELANAGWNVITVWECELEKHPQTTLAGVIEQLTGAQ